MYEKTRIIYHDRGLLAGHHTELGVLAAILILASTSQRLNTLVTFSLKPRPRFDYNVTLSPWQRATFVHVRHLYINLNINKGSSTNSYGLTHSTSTHLLY